MKHTGTRQEISSTEKEGEIQSWDSEDVMLDAGKGPAGVSPSRPVRQVGSFREAPES